MLPQKNPNNPQQKIPNNPPTNRKINPTKTTNKKPTHRQSLYTHTCIYVEWYIYVCATAVYSLVKCSEQ